MIFQLIALLLGILGLYFHFSSLIYVSLSIFILTDVIGLIIGNLKFGIGLFLPLVPMFFVKPWFVGLIIGFVIISLFELIPSAIHAIYKYLNDSK